MKGETIMKRRAMVLKGDKWEQGYVASQFDRMFRNKFRLISSDEKELVVELIKFSVIDELIMLKKILKGRNYYIGRLKD